MIMMKLMMMMMMIITKPNIYWLPDREHLSRQSYHDHDEVDDDDDDDEDVDDHGGDHY